MLVSELRLQVLVVYLKLLDIFLILNDEILDVSVLMLKFLAIHAEASALVLVDLGWILGGINHMHIGERIRILDFPALEIILGFIDFLGYF